MANKITTIIDAQFKGNAEFKKAKTEVENLNKQAKQASSGIGLMNGALGASLGAMVSLAAVYKAARFAKDLITAASDAAETMNKMNEVFGESKNVVESFSETAAQTTGASKESFQAMASEIGNLLVPMGFAQDAAASMSVQVVKLAADLGSFNNIPTAEALDKIRSGLVGEAMPLRSVGVALSEVRIRQEALNLGLIKGKEDLSAYAKAQATMALIMKDTTLAQGDFARTADGLANSTKTLQGEFEDLKVKIGNGLLPVAQNFVAELNDLLSFVEENIDAMNELGGAADSTGFSMQDMANTIGGTVSESLKGMILLVGSLAEALNSLHIPDFFTSGLKTVKGTLEAVGQAAGGFAEGAIVGVSTGNFQDFVDSATQGAEDARKTFEKLSDEIYAVSAEGKALAKQTGGAKAEAEKIQQKKTGAVGGGGGTVKAGGGGGSSDAAKKAEQEAKKIADEQKKIYDSLRKTQTGFNELRTAGVDSLEDLRKEHEKAMKDMAQKSADLRKELLGISQAYEETTAGFDKSLAERVVEQEQTVSELQKQLKDALSSGQTGEGSLAVELEAELAKQKKALDEFNKSNAGLEEEIKAARDKAALTDFERFQKDLETKRTEAEKDYQDKLKKIQDELAAVEKQSADEQVIYDNKRQAIEKINEQIKNNWSNILADMGQRTEAFATLAEAKLEAIRKAFEAVQNISGGVTSASDLRATGEYLTPEQKAAVSAAGSTTINLTLDVGGITTGGNTDVNALLAKLKTELARAADLIAKKVSSTPNM